MLDGNGEKPVTIFYADMLISKYYWSGKELSWLRSHGKQTAPGFDWKHAETTHSRQPPLARFVLSQGVIAVFTYPQTNRVKRGNAPCFRTPSPNDPGVKALEVWSPSVDPEASFALSFVFLSFHSNIFVTTCNKRAGHLSLASFRWNNQTIIAHLMFSWDIFPLQPKVLNSNFLAHLFDGQ